jgi:alpha-L-glutamate ligase-like protein
MIFTWARRLREAGILGMNRRNAEYIMRFNPRSVFPLVDNKLLTKEVAERFAVPTTAVFLVVKNHGDIPKTESALTDQREFVIKPARGSGGSGIVLIVDRSEKGFVTQSGEALSREDFTYHLADVLSGIYSLGGHEDVVILEALIHPAPVFEEVTYQGVPDVRIIVYRGVPVMAMVRLPTRASDGKANLHRGAIGAGIDLATGKTTAAVHRSDLVSAHPDTGKPVNGISVPYWEQMLLMAAVSMEMTGLGFLGMDLAIDRDQGPLLLELNARPGLAIQIANQSGLWARLEKVDEAPPEAFATPTSRVEWAQNEFRVKIKSPDTAFHPISNLNS